MKQNILSFFIALMAGFALVSCSSEDTPEEVVGITAGTLTPSGSTINYTVSPTAALELVCNDVAWDVTDAALEASVLKVTPTPGATVTVNGEQGTNNTFTVNVLTPVTLTVKGSSGKTVVYTLKVSRKQTADQGLTLKASAANGLPDVINWMDVTLFKGLFYAYVVSTSDGSNNQKQEHYRLFTSKDALNWTETAYTVDVPNEVIGGEGSHFAVLGDKLFLIGGARTMGTDKYGNAPETDQGWTGTVPAVKKWRAFVTTDGVSFRSLESVTKIMKNGSEVAANQLSAYNNPYASVAVFNGKIFVRGGYAFAFGMAQTSLNYLSSADGINWEVINAVDNAGASVKELPTLGFAFYTFGNKLWIAGGFRNYIGSSTGLNKAVWSSTDGVTWNKEVEQNAAFDNLYQMSYAATDKMVLLFGGETYNSDKTRTLGTQAFKSTDGKTFTPMSVPSTFVGARWAATAITGQAVWFFGGYPNLTSGNYGNPGISDRFVGNIWNAPNQ